MPSGRRPSTRPSRASARAEAPLAGLALLATLALAARADARPGAEGGGRPVHRSAAPVRGAWDRPEGAGEGTPADAPPPVDVPTRPDASSPGESEHPRLDPHQADGMGLGLELATDPTAPHAGRAEALVRWVIVPSYRERRALHAGFAAFLHTGVGWSQSTDSLSGESRWVVAYLVGAEPGFLVMCNRGLYLRVGVDVRLQVRRQPLQLDFAPRFAFGYDGPRRGFEVGVGYEPFFSERLHDGGEGWDATSRAWMLFFRVDFLHDRL